MIKSRIWLAVSGKTAGEGPVMLGMSMNGTAANIEAAIEADPQSVVEDDNHPKAHYVKPLEMITKAFQEGIGSAQVEGGHTLTPNWSCPEGQDLLFWAYNMDTSALTTGMIVDIFAEHYGVWLRD